MQQSTYDDQVIPTLLRKRGTSAEEGKEEEDPSKATETAQPVPEGQMTQD